LRFRVHSLFRPSLEFSLVPPLLVTQEACRPGHQRIHPPHKLYRGTFFSPSDRCRRPLFRALDALAAFPPPRPSCAFLPLFPSSSVSSVLPKFAFVPPIRAVDPAKLKFPLSFPPTTKNPAPAVASPRRLLPHPFSLTLNYRLNA